MSREVEQPSLDEYPVHESLEKLAGETIYNYQGWWLAVLKVKSTYQGKERVNVRIYRWRYKKDREGNMRWMVDRKMPINSKKQWEQIKAAVEKLI